MKKLSFKAFSLVELLVVITIIAIIGAIVISSNDGFKEKTYNTKVITDLSTVQKSLIRYKQENIKIPLPKGNLKYFTNNGSYAHDDTEAFGVNGFLTEDTIPKRYISILPRDPRTKQYYAYGSKISGGIFEISGILSYKDKLESIVTGNYDSTDPLNSTGTEELYNLIREYNGPEFVYDKSVKNFPYNPEEMILTARVTNFTGNLLINDIPQNKSSVLNRPLISGDNIKLSAGSTATIYYSDGTLSELGGGAGATELTLAVMKYKKDSNLYTKIRIALNFGTILTKASKMDKESNFDLYTTDLEASVRGTVFQIKKVPGEKTIVEVKRGSVLINKVILTSDVSTRYKELVDNLKNDIPLNLQKIVILALDNSNLIGVLEDVAIDGQLQVLLREKGSADAAGTSVLPNTWNLNVCAPDTILGTCSGTNPVNSTLTSGDKFKQTYDLNTGTYGPTTKSIGYNQPECGFTCNAGYIYDGISDCVINTCPTGTHYNESSVCVSNTDDCPVTNGTGQKTWNVITNSRNACVITCNGGRHLEGGACLLNTQACSITGGAGQQTWNFGTKLRSVCTVTTCNGGRHLEGGACLLNTQACPVTNGTGQKTWNFGTKLRSVCTVTTCNGGRHLEGGACLLNTQACSITGGAGQQTWNFGTKLRSVCTVTTCNGGRHLEGGACLLNTQACPITKGTGKKTWNGVSRSVCTVTSCNSHYQISGNSCVAETRTFNCSARPAYTTRNTVSHYTQTWNGSGRTPSNSSPIYNTIPRNNSCRYKCSSGANRNGVKCIKCSSGYTWDTGLKKCKKIISGNGCSSCPYGSSKGVRYGNCSGFGGNRYYYKCDGINVVCGLEKSWSSSDTNCNDVESKPWSATIYE